MSEFILEIGTEEMPARFVPRLGEELVELFERLLAEARIDHSGVRAYATPRRLVAHVSGLALAQRLWQNCLAENDWFGTTYVGTTQKNLR